MVAVGGGDVDVAVQAQQADGRAAQSCHDARRLHPTGTPPQVWVAPGGPVSVAFQVWDWRGDGKRYDLQHFHLVGSGDDRRVARRTTCCWAITRDELTDCARQTGLASLTWLLPAESGFFQPLLMAR